MLTIFGVQGRRIAIPSACVAIGVFDGVHLGHREVIRRGVLEARSQGLPAVVLTFDRHPLEVLRPDAAPLLLSTLCQRLHIFESLEVDITVVMNFDAQMANMTHEEFLQDVILDSLRAAKVVVGHDFAFGKGRAGTAEWLATQVPTVVVEPVMINGERVSSSGIRAQVAAGDVEAAAELLGRLYAIEGVVVPGRNLGTSLAMPTANLAMVDRFVIPAEGVYAGWAQLGNQVFETAISVGNRPSIPGAGFAIEAHLIGYQGSALYGRTMQLEFVRMVRGQERFDDLEILANKMKEDVEKIHSLLERHRA